THYPAFGAQRYFHGDGQFRWIGALAVLLGAFERPGGGVAFSKDEMALFPGFLRPVQKNVRRLPVGTWPLELEGLTPPVEVAVVSGADPLRQNPGSSAVRVAWKKIPFTVCADFVLSDTAEASDLVLPVTTFLEEEGDWKGSYWHNYLVRSERVLPPRGEAREELEIYTRLARRLGLACDLLTLKGEMDRAMLANPALEPLGEGVYRWSEPEYWRDPKSRATLPLKVPEMQGGPEGSLRLVTVHKKEYINGQSWDAPGVPSLPLLSLNPADGTARGVADGAQVLLRRAGGAEDEALLITVAFDPSIGRGYCILPQGTRGVNLLTEPLASPGWGAPFAESWITLAPEEKGIMRDPSGKR
ncbi:MAG: molybdopterin-dependent oxidoreductase, partial [Synergistaceae bacterium]|nr:molybdopterin-dependent oxidoreductase [Synergistaceae bacterium]